MIKSLLIFNNMKKIFLILIILFAVFVMKQNVVEAVLKGGEKCTIHKAVNHVGKCDQVCDVIDGKVEDNSLIDDRENITDIVCKTCGNTIKPDKDGNIYASFRTLYQGCCHPGQRKPPCDYAVNYCDYSKNNLLGTCSKTIKTQSLTDSQGYCYL